MLVSVGAMVAGVGAVRVSVFHDEMPRTAATARKDHRDFSKETLHIK